MDLLCQEIGIPKKQIKETRNPSRFVVLTKKSWLKHIAQSGKVTDFPIYNNLDEWPKYDDNTFGGYSWCQVYMHVYKKLNHKVIPLPRFRNEYQSETEQPLSFSQLLHYVSQSNHKNVWKAAYKEYSASRMTNLNLNFASDGPSSGKKLGALNTGGGGGTSNSESSIVLLPYDNVLREVIHRIYGVQIIDLNNIDGTYDPNNGTSMSKQYFTSLLVENCHTNLYPVIGSIETSSQIILIYDTFIEHTLYDCLTYSPAILDKSNNKQLFIIYQILNLMKSFHDKGLLLGEINLNDIFITENLWLYVIPKLDCNTITLNEIDSYGDITPTPLNVAGGLSSVSNKKISDNSVNLNFFNGPSAKLNKLKNLQLNYSLLDYCELWCHGQISNFDYLIILNNLTGRRIGCAEYHHIMPWVTDFTSKNGTNWRDLTKSKYRLNKGDPQLDLMFTSTASTCSTNNIPHHVSDVLSEITYYVYMARRTPKSILCRHVRPIWVPAEYPASIQRLQEWTPDECIPEFYNDPIVFKSIHEDLPDLEVPSWSSCPENFITKHREALESQYVSERLHHWIDLTFGYKLMGQPAIKAKNVCLSIVDDHKNLSKHGVVQLFQHPHPPKQFPSIWNSKLPPRIYQQQNEIKRRLTRSSEDLSTDDNNANIIERSTSYHQQVQKINNSLIILPKDYNPVLQLQQLENMENFAKKTFYNQSAKSELANINIELNNRNMNLNYDEDSDNSFTNRIFVENFQESLLLKNQNTSNQNKNFKQVVSERRFRELQILGCLIVEIFLSSKLRPMNGGSESIVSFSTRLNACQNLLQFDLDLLPKFIQYPVKLLFDNNSSIITDKGLPNPSSHQLLQPLLSNSLFPFPNTYIQIYSLLKSLIQFDLTFKLLNLLTFFECDGKNCRRYENLDKTFLMLEHKISECKVKSCVYQINTLLDSIGYEQFNSIELILPHIIDLINSNSTSIMATWHLFDPIATALGRYETKNMLLDSILKLYNHDSDDRIKFLNSLNYDQTMKIRNLNEFKIRNIKKSYKLYHHSFLIKLIVRFGLKIFLENFITSLIEGVGGYKDLVNENIVLHSHYNDNFINKKLKLNMSYDDSDIIHNSPESEKSSSSSSSSTTSIDVSMITKKINDDLFEFEQDFKDAKKVSSPHDLLKMNEPFDDKDTKNTSNLELLLNHSHAEEVLEDTPINEGNTKFYADISRLNSSFDEDGISNKSIDSPQKSPNIKAISSNQTISSTIPIPSTSTYHHGKQLSSIGCDIGSKKSFDSNEFFMTSSSSSNNLKSSTANEINNKFLNLNHSIQISEMSAESLIWLSHRLGPVLTARYISRNLLKMLTLCYVGQENLFPYNCVSSNDELNTSIHFFSIADGRVVGDQNSVKVLECLIEISKLFGEQFILLQYFPHVSELIALCKKRITATIEGGLISSLQLLKYLVPFLNDATLMDQLHDIILRSIIHPIIRLLGSSRAVMPSGFLARSVLARKLLDTVYVLAIRIGPEMTREHLCVPALQRFFYIFNKAYGITDQSKFLDFKNQESSPSNSDDSNFVEIRRDGGTREWCIKGSPLQISHARVKGEDSFESITPPIPQASTSYGSDGGNQTLKEKAMEEIQDVFTPNLAHTAYSAFLKFLGEAIMTQTVKNLPLILNICHEYEQSDPGENVNPMTDSINLTDLPDDDSLDSNNFGTNVAVVGNRIEVQEPEIKTSKVDLLNETELLNLVSYRSEQINTARHLRGNWLAYWEHEIGRSDKDNQFNLKQIKLQSFHGHANSVRVILPLDNENSFMTASKDKTVKLWSLRSEGDGTKISSCQLTYTNHKKSVHSLTFLESHRLTISCDSGVHLWDPFVGQPIALLDSPKYSPVIVVKTYPAPSSLVVCGTADSLIKTIDTRCFTYVNEWRISPNPAGSVRCVALSPSGSWIGVGLSSGQIILLDGRTGIIVNSWRGSEGELLQLVAPNENQLVSSSLDHSISVWNTIDGSLMFHMKSPPEPAVSLIYNGNELITGTPANRIGIHSSISRDSVYTLAKLRSENFRGVLTSLAVLPLNRMFLVGGDSGNITLLC